MTTSEAKLYRQMPRFPWRRPVAFDHGHGRRRYACRICMAVPGKVRADEGITGWDTPAEVEAHITREHPDAP